MKMTRTAILVLGLSVALLLSLASCSSSNATPPPAQASGPTTNPQGSYQLRSDTGVDVLYFEETHPCECMAEIGVVVKNCVRTHFAGELQNGSLRFFVIYTDDWANREVFELFKNQPFDLFIVEFEDGKGVATPVHEFWSMMGDDEAIDLHVKARVEESLAKVG